MSKSLWPTPTATDRVRDDETMQKCADLRKRNANQNTVPLYLGEVARMTDANDALGYPDSTGSSISEQQAIQRPRGGDEGRTVMQPGCPWSDAQWIAGADGKSRRVEPGVRLVAHGIPARVAKLRALGNAIVPQVAAEFIRAYLECEEVEE